MKKSLFLLLVGCCSLVWAQTNLPVAKKNNPEHLKISAKSLEGSPATQIIYSGDVQVKTSDGNMTCDRLTSTGGMHPTNIVAEGSVVVVAVDEKGATNHIVADKAIYTYTVLDAMTNEIITLTNNVWITNGLSWQTGDLFVYDLRTKQIHGSGHIVTGFDGPLNFNKDTNAPPLKTAK